MKAASVQHLQKCISGAAEDLIRNVEVASVVEELLQDVEVWQWANEAKRLEVELQQSQDTIQQLRHRESSILAKQAEVTAELELERTKAHELKESLAKELWTVAKALHSSKEDKVRLQQLEARVQQLSTLEGELGATKAELLDVQTALEQAQSRVAEQLMLQQGPATAEAFAVAPGPAAEHTMLNLAPSALAKLLCYLDAASTAKLAAASPAWRQQVGRRDFGALSARHCIQRKLAE